RPRGACGALGIIAAAKPSSEEFQASSSALVSPGVAIVPSGRPQYGTAWRTSRPASAPTIVVTSARVAGVSRSQTSQAADPVSIAQWAASQPRPQPRGLTASCAHAIDRTSWSTYRTPAALLRPTTAGS